jgi:magnesium-transporting ATPase (P-type)
VHVNTDNSDKTGTLTMNQMTVVEGYIGNKVYPQDVLRTAGAIPPELMDLVTQNCAINRSCDVHFKVRVCFILAAAVLLCAACCLRSV